MNWERVNANLYAISYSPNVCNTLHSAKDLTRPEANYCKEASSSKLTYACQLYFNQNEHEKYSLISCNLKLVIFSDNVAKKHIVIMA
jgi:hypothetical protein